MKILENHGNVKKKWSVSMFTRLKGSEQQRQINAVNCVPIVTGKCWIVSQTLDSRLNEWKHRETVCSYAKVNKDRATLSMLRVQDTSWRFKGKHSPTVETETMCQISNVNNNNNNNNIIEKIKKNPNVYQVVLHGNWKSNYKSLKATIYWRTANIWVNIWINPNEYNPKVECIKRGE